MGSPMIQEYPKQSIDLPDSLDGMAAAVCIDENLPTTFGEIWYDADEGGETYALNEEEHRLLSPGSEHRRVLPTQVLSMAEHLSGSSEKDGPCPTINLVNDRGEPTMEGNLGRGGLENPPPPSGGIWTEKDCLEEEQPPAPLIDWKIWDKGVWGGQNQNKTDEDRWLILMNKLTNIENNTGSLSEDVKVLESRVESNEEQITATKSAVARSENKIAHLNKRYDSAWAEVDQKITEKFLTMHATMTEANEAFRIKIMQEAENKNEAFRIEVMKEAENKHEALRTEILQETEDKNEAFRVEVKKEADNKVQEIKKEMQDDIIQGQCNHRKINLMVMGIPESNGEEAKDDAKDLVVSFFSQRMSISQAGVDIAYRLGKNANHDKPRPIMVRFKEMAYRNKVWFSKSKIIQEGYDRAWIQEDLPKAVKNSYRTFYRILKKAKSLGDRFTDAHIKGQSLFIEGKAYGEEDLEQLPDVLRPSNLATLQSDRAVIFFGRFSPLSNHYKATFVIKGTEFSCMEQYLAWSRATHAGRANLANKALKPADPVVYKGILNELKANKSNDASKTQIANQWYEQLDDTVGQGLRAKFQQNPALARFLCNTYPKALGEACPDTRWGIGYILTDPNAFDVDKWPSEGNTMGRQLSIIRDELIANKND